MSRSSANFSCFALDLNISPLDWKGHMITVSISIVGIDSANSKNKKLQLNFLQFIKIQKGPQKNKTLIRFIIDIWKYVNKRNVDKLHVHKRLSFSCLLWTLSMQHYSIDGNKPS